MERLGIIVALDGSLETSNGLKLTSDAAAQLGKQLDTLNAKTGAAAQGQKAVADASKTAGTAAAEAAKNVAQLGRDVAQGDFAGAARQVGELALSSQVLTGSMVGVAGLVGAVALGLGTLAYAAFQGAEEERKLNDSLILTGNYAGLVAGQLDTMASSLARNVNSSVSDSRAMLAGLTATGKFTVMSLEEVASAAQLVARFTGQSGDQVVRQFASMGDSASEWAAKTNESYHFLQLETFRYIQQLEKQGRNQEAARVTSEALSRHLGGDLTNNLGTLQKAWKGVSDWAKDAWQSMMDIGKTETTKEKIANITGQLNALATRKSTGRMTSDQRDQLVANLQSQRGILESDLRQEERLATMRSDRAVADAAGIKKLMDKPKKSGKSAAEKEDDAQTRLIAETAGLSPTFAADWDRLTEIQRRNGLTVEWLTEAQAKLLAKQPAIRTEVQHQATALRELTQLRERANQNMERDFANQEKELETMIKTNEGLREQAQQVGLTKEQLGKLKAERLDGLIAQERENLIVAESNDAGERQLELMRRKISLLEQQRGLTQNLTARTAEADKTKAAEDASKKFGEDVRRDLRDGVIRGLEAGKSGIRAFGDTLGNVAKERLMGAFADSILNTFEPLLKQVLGRLQIPGLGGGGGGDGGGLGGIFDSIFGGGGGADIIPQGVAASAAEFGGGGMMDALASFGVFHSGGMAGGAAPGSRTVSASLFKGAPRFHGGGIASNERAIIAKDDEGIFTRDQMANMAPVGSGAAPIINIYTAPGTKAETKQRQGANGGMQIDVIISQIEEALGDRVNAGTGALFGAMGSRFNLQTAVG